MPLRVKGTGGGLRVKSTGVGGVTAINPNTLADLVAWYKADSLDLINGATVTSWPDNSPNSNNLTSYESTPTFNTVDALLNGMPSVTFDGNGSLYRTNPTGLPVGSAAHTTYIVGYWDGTSGNHSMFGWGANAYTGSRLGVFKGDSGFAFESQGIGSSYRTISTNVPFIFSFPYVAGTNYTAATSYLNGVEATGANAAGTPNIIDPVSEITIGRPATAGVERWTGAVAEVIVFNTTHSAATRAGIEKYLSNKYNISITSQSQFVSRGMRVKIPPPPPPAIPIDTTNLILYLDAGNATSFPGSGTTWYDLSGNGNDAQALGTPTYTATNGGGFNFNSSADYFDTAPNLRESYTATGLTAAAWVKADDFPYVSAIIARNDWNGSDGWALHEHFNNTIMGPRYTQAVSNNSAVTTGVVYYVAFTIDTSGNAKVYINGVQNGSTATSVTLPTASSVSPLIGVFPYYGFPWVGDIYQLHVYSRDLSSAEMLANFNATKSRYGL